MIPCRQTSPRDIRQGQVKVDDFTMPLCKLQSNKDCDWNKTKTSVPTSCTGLSILPTCQPEDKTWWLLQWRPGKVLSLLCPSFWVKLSVRLHCCYTLPLKPKGRQAPRDHCSSAPWREVERLTAGLSEQPATKSLNRLKSLNGVPAAELLLCGGCSFQPMYQASELNQ